MPRLFLSQCQLLFCHHGLSFAHLFAHPFHQ
jgi:hypothetical protein